MMKNKFEPIPDPTEEDGFEGIYVGDLEDGEKCSTEFSSYDLCGLTKYLQEHNLNQYQTRQKKMDSKVYMSGI